MALATVGGAFLSSFLNVLFDRMASHEFIDFFKTRKMDMELLEEMEVLLNTVNGVLDDAENKQITSPAVKNWLEKLRDAAYEADDLLDGIDYEVTRQKVDAEQQTAANSEGIVRRLKQKRTKWIVRRIKRLVKRGYFSKDQNKEMKEIVRRLKQLVKQSGALGLRDGGRKYAWSEREPTTSVVEESDVYGRDGDKEAIFRLLQADGNGIGVIPIVGMGGIGKTTLAQLVYNDIRVQNLFEIRAWVCVSENYDGFKIKREVLKQANNSEGYDGSTPQQIDEELRKSLKDKRFLLVLDDMWNNNYADWSKLQTPLESGACGSKIIVTTRNQSVASIMCTVPSSYQLSELNDDFCWLLFLKHAFNGGTVNDESLEAIGKKIVNKCKGLPLAAKMLGGLLRCKREFIEWEEILNSNTWDLPDDNILPALRLSYQHLPSYLKQCFAYCAIFPKDYKMRREEIIQLWMAEGFLVKPVRGKKMEELGEECLIELVSRSFLQESRYRWGGPPFFCMHDLINDLAKSISENFLERVEGKNSYKIARRNRHFSYMASEIDASKIVEVISEAQTLRTFLAMPLNRENRYYRKPKEIADELLHNQIPYLRCLRVLSLCGFDSIVKLPESIGNLKHLRYLNLSETRVKKLPESVCTLYNLQTLILYRCYELVELPKKTGSLVNLHFLDIRDTPGLKETPPRTRNLKDLRTLCKFFVGKQNGCDIDELGNLQHLRGELSVFNLQNVVDTPKDILKNKKHLEYLKLKWGGETEGAVDEISVLEGLQPYTSIKELSIHGYRGTKFADWVGDSSYTNIVDLELKGCEYCTSLPPLGQLSFLKYLSISKFDAVVKVGLEFAGKCSVSVKKPFMSLKELLIEEMSQWQEWIICEENDSVKCNSFPKLESLIIRDCPKLRCITTCEPTHKIFKSTKKLEVENCPSFKTSNLIAISNFKKLQMKNKCGEVISKQLPSAMYSLDYTYLEESNHTIEEVVNLFSAADFEEIRIFGNKVLQSIPLEMFPRLESLHLSRCDNLKSLSTSLEITDCPSLVYLLKGGRSAPKLTHLKLSYCSSLKFLPECMNSLLPSLLHLSIYACRELESFSEGGLPTNLQSLEITSCDKLIGGRSQWGLQRLNALSRLRLAFYYGDDLETFPERTLLPSSLTSLQIIRFENLKVISYKGLQHLTSLAVLEIQNCPNLQCLPEERLPSSLFVLEIWRCHLLEERCEPEKGEDWPKISHISTIEINGKAI